jgi:hypothetical protein
MLFLGFAHNPTPPISHPRIRLAAAFPPVRQGRAQGILDAIGADTLGLTEILARLDLEGVRERGRVQSMCSKLVANGRLERVGVGMYRRRA